MFRIKLSNHVVRSIPPLILFILVGCGQMGMLFAPAPQPAVVIPGRVFEFTEYVHPNQAFSWVVPVGARITTSSDGLKMTSEYEDADLIHGRYTQEVEIVPPAGVESPQDLLLREFSSAQNPSPVTAIEVDDQKLIGAKMTFEVGTGKVCPRPRALAVALIQGRQAYIMRIESDARDRCDAATLDETKGVITSFRIP